MVEGRILLTAVAMNISAHCLALCQRAVAQTAQSKNHDQQTAINKIRALSKAQLLNDFQVRAFPALAVTLLFLVILFRRFSNCYRPVIAD